MFLGHLRPSDFSDIEYDIINFDAVEDLYKTLAEKAEGKKIEELDVQLNDEDADMDIDW